MTNTYTITQIHEGPFVGRYAVIRAGERVAVFGTKAAAKHYLEQHSHAQVPSR